MDMNDLPKKLPASVRVGGAVFEKGVDTEVFLRYLSRIATYPEELREKMSQKTEDPAGTKEKSLMETILENANRVGLS